MNEARDLGDVNRYQFYDHLKAYQATPPDVLRVDEKHLREHSVLNCSGIIITTNYIDGLYLPSDDRRHYVAWSELAKEDFAEDYWPKLWGWYYGEGMQHVTAYFRTLDISTFDPKAPPPTTAAFWDMVNSNRSTEEAELADLLDQMGNPDAVTLEDIIEACRGGPVAELKKRAEERGDKRPWMMTLNNAWAFGNFLDWITDRKNRRVIPHRMADCGYVRIRNGDAKDGLWKIDGRQVVYAKDSLSVTQRFAAAQEKVGAGQ